MRQQLEGIASALAWLVFPLIPAVLGSSYHGTFNLGPAHGGPDPHDWGWGTWIVLTGPLWGYGFLAGATLGLPDEPGRRGVRSWLARRAVWVAVGPWIGFVFWGGVYLAARVLEDLLNWAFPASREWHSSGGIPWQGPSSSPLVNMVLLVGLLGSLAYGWLIVAAVALKRARRLGRCRWAIGRGLAAAVGFVGSLFGTFWTIISVWRGYFFDPRVMPVWLAAASLLMSAGCAGTITYGEVRRRELFQALLMAWLLGLALAWRWWSRPRRGP
jgi:hypothetical protein